MCLLFLSFPLLHRFVLVRGRGHLFGFLQLLFYIRQLCCPEDIFLPNFPRLPRVMETAFIPKSPWPPVSGPFLIKSPDFMRTWTYWRYQGLGGPYSRLWHDHPTTVIAGAAGQDGSGPYNVHMWVLHVAFMTLLHIPENLHKLSVF